MLPSSPPPEEQFFADYCADWTDEDFERPDLDEALERFTYVLAKAPFSLDDVTLNPEMGACSACPFNTASASLFPELAAKAVCTNSKCFDHKSDAQFLNGLRGLVQLKQPTALLFYGAPSPYLRKMVEQVPELKEVHTYNYYQVDIISAPEPPLKEDYYFEGEEGEEGEPDDEGYTQGVEEYNAEKAEFEQALIDKALLEGMLITETKIGTVLFNPDPNWHKVLTQGRKELPTAKAVQAAIKAGTATVELLTGEIERIETRASRNRQLDREKVQQTVYKEVVGKLETGGSAAPLTEKDWPAVWFLIFKSLDWSSQSDVEETLWPAPEGEENEETEQDSIYARMQRLTPAQCAYLVRKAVTSKAESKSATSDLGYFLYQMAGSLSIDTEAIEQNQLEKADTRQEKNEARIRDLNKRIKRLAARQARAEEVKQ
ncbi:hypothetical protein ACQ86N_02700 [Puia sp. P3]|uniref:hypothetical protein n=1 Tax=Puia sp. P3 TaxID=3423952 RepID=UPI003D666A0A